MFFVYVLIKSHERLGEWSHSKVIKLGIDPRGNLDTHLPSQEGGVIDGCQRFVIDRGLHRTCLHFQSEVMPSVEPKGSCPRGQYGLCARVIFFKELPAPIIGKVQMIAVNVIAALALDPPDQNQCSLPAPSRHPCSPGN